MMQKAYKLLTAEGRSLSTRHGAVYYPLPHDGQPGEWIDVPGKGAFLGTSVPELLAGGWGPLLAEVEALEVSPSVLGISTASRIRILRMALIDARLLVRVAEWAVSQAPCYSGVARMNLSRAVYQCKRGCLAETADAVASAIAAASAWTDRAIILAHLVAEAWLETAENGVA